MKPLRVYTESGSIVTLVDGFLNKWNHIRLLQELQTHVESASVRVRDDNGIEWFISVGLLRLDNNLLRLINAA